MGDEPRAGILGRAAARREDRWVSTFPRKGREGYLVEFLDDLTTYSFKVVRQGVDAPRVDRELDGIVNHNPEDPVECARVLKEHVHNFFNANTAYNYMRAFLTFFREGAHRDVLDKMKDLPSRHVNCEKDEYVYRNYPER
jgi:hypothetical protein